MPSHQARRSPRESQTARVEVPANQARYKAQGTQARVLGSTTFKDYGFYGTGQKGLWHLLVCLFLPSLLLFFVRLIIGAELLYHPVWEVENSPWHPLSTNLQIRIACAFPKFQYSPKFPWWHIYLWLNCVVGLVHRLDLRFLRHYLPTNQLPKPQSKSENKTLTNDCCHYNQLINRWDAQHCEDWDSVHEESTCVTRLHSWLCNAVLIRKRALFLSRFSRSKDIKIACPCKVIWTTAVQDGDEIHRTEYVAQWQVSPM